MVGDFVIDVCLVELSTLQRLELRDHFVAICFQTLARGALFRGNAELFHQRGRLCVHCRVVADHQFRELLDALVVGFFNGQFPGIDIHTVGYDGDHGDLGIGGDGFGGFAERGERDSGENEGE